MESNDNPRPPRLLLKTAAFPSDAVSSAPHGTSLMPRIWLPSLHFSHRCSNEIQFVLQTLVLSNAPDLAWCIERVQKWEISPTVLRGWPDVIPAKQHH